MAIESIGIGTSSMSTGAWNNSRGLSAYQNNDISRSSAALQPALKGENGKGEDVGYKNANVSDAAADIKRRFDTYECQTCENRRYQDGSDDSGVSYQTPTKIDPETAAAAVRGHEQEHVVRNQAKAEVEGKEIVSQSVTLHTGICEECGRVYIAGGTTRTVTKNADDSQKYDVGIEKSEKGGILDVAV